MAQFTPGDVVASVTIENPSVVASISNSTSTPLAAGATFTGTMENIQAFEQINFTLWGRPNVISSGDAYDAVGSLFFEFSSDEGTHWDISVPVVVRTLGLFVPYPIIPVAAHFRLRYVNDGGALAIAILGTNETVGTVRNQTEFRLVTYLLPFATKEITRTLDQGISGSDPVILTRTVGASRNPDRTNFLNNAGLGTRTLYPTPALLGGGQVYTSNWMDCEQYPNLKLLVASDQPSTDSGISLQWSDQSGGTVRTIETHTFRSAHINNGLLIISSTRARYLRVVYQNGLVAQGRFFLNLRLNTVPVVSEVGITPTAGAKTSQQDVNTSASMILPSPLADRNSLRIKNLSSSARAAFYGFSAGLTTANGDELAPGEAVDLDIDEFVQVWVVCFSTSGSGVRIATTEIG